MKSPYDLTGNIYKRLTVIDEVLPQQRPRKWNCVCQCGTGKAIIGSSLKNGNTTSCGCFQKEQVTLHGESNTRLYSCWAAMIKRCTKSTDRSYQFYGAIGITVCQEWLNSFESFRDWALHSGYSDELSIDRIQGASVYSPTTCRWETPIIQARNRRKRTSTLSKFIGVYRTGINTYHVELTVNKKVISLGTHTEEETAAKIRDTYIRTHSLTGFTLNFP
jgi:hypothetical protein